jgi:hypothetical protein
MKIPDRLGRLSFWRWAVPLTLAHTGLSVAVAAGVSGLAVAGMLIVVVLALVLVARFRDIGWPVWIGPSFLFGTMVVLPLVMMAYTTASHLPPARIKELAGRISRVVGPINLALLVVAGSVPSRTAAGPEVNAPQSVGEGSPVAAGGPTSGAPGRSRWELLWTSGAGAVAVVMVVIFLARMLAPPHGQPGQVTTVTTPSSPPVQLTGPQVEGLGKDTSDKQ